MNDKELLTRINIAYKVYPYPSKEIESFINWMYKQYGIVQPEKKDGES
jgi:hypothetical protein